MNLKEEAEANAFAMSLLMPEILIKRELEKIVTVQRKEDEIVSKMASRFAVTETAMRSRLFDLGYITML